MKKKEKTYSFYFRSFIRRNVHQIIYNNRWSQEKKQQIEFSGIECNIYIPMIIHYLNMIQVKFKEKVNISNAINFFLDLYTQSTHLHPPHMHHHSQYQHENLSLSPQQSSTSDADETLTPPPSLNRGVVCFSEIDLITSYFFLLLLNRMLLSQRR